MRTPSRRSRQQAADLPSEPMPPTIIVRQADQIAVGIVQQPRNGRWITWMWDNPFFWYLAGYSQQEQAIVAAQACFAILEQPETRRTPETEAAITDLVLQAAFDVHPIQDKTREALLQMLGLSTPSWPPFVWPREKSTRSAEEVEQELVSVLAELFIRAATKSREIAEMVATTSELPSDK
jgi:hypothetical protein